MMLQIPAAQVPSYRKYVADQAGVSSNILIRVTRGMGDQLCAEPTARFAKKLYPTKTISVETDYPEFFTHLGIPVYKPGIADHSQFWVLDTFPDTQLASDFICAPIMNSIDHASISALRIQLPVGDREIQFEVEDASNDLKKTLTDYNSVIVHPGRNDSLKMNTFPKEWWEGLLQGFMSRGITPILLGKNIGHVGYVDCSGVGCIDLRNKTTLKETMWLCKNAQRVVANDSSILHIAAAGGAKIAFFAVWKHPDFVTHFRGGEWSYRMKNFSKGGVYIITHEEPRDYDFNPDFLDTPQETVKNICGWAPS